MLWERTPESPIHFTNFRLSQMLSPPPAHIGLGSSRRHLQSGNSLSGSLHYGINSDDDILPIPQPPLPPTSVPPHLNHLIINCTEDPMHGMDDDDDEDDTDLDSELPSMSMHINHQHHSGKFAIRNIETH